MFAKRFLLKNRELIASQIDVILWFYGQVLNQQHIEFVSSLSQDSRSLQDVIGEHPGRKLVILDDMNENASNLI